MHVLKQIILQGEIQQEYFPTVTATIKNTQICLFSSLPEKGDSLHFIADTGFSGALVLDSSVLKRINKDFVGVDTVTLAGGIVQKVNMYLIGIWLGQRKFSDIEALEMPGELLMGMSLMKAICRRVVFSFTDDRIFFEA